MDNYIHTKLAFATKCYNVSENVQFSARSQHSGVGQSAKGVQQVGAECGGAISKPVQLLPKVPDCRSCRCIVPQRGTRVPAATVPFRLHAKIYSIISGCIRFVCCINFFLFCWKRVLLRKWLYTEKYMIKIQPFWKWQCSHQHASLVHTNLGRGALRVLRNDISNKGVWYSNRVQHLHFHLSEELKKGIYFSSIYHNRKIGWNNPL